MTVEIIGVVGYVCAFMVSVVIFCILIVGSSLVVLWLYDKYMLVVGLLNGKRNTVRLLRLIVKYQEEFRDFLEKKGIDSV